MDNAIIKEKTGRDHPLIVKAEPPDCQAALLVWDLYFRKLRGAGVSYTEIKSYQELTGLVLAPWQIDLIFIIHNAVEGFYHDKHKSKIKK